MKSIYLVHEIPNNREVHIVPDLETLSTKYNAAILSIGAVAVCDGKIVAEFYRNVENLYVLGPDYDISASTLLWWSDPERAEALKSLNDDALPIYQALVEFYQWCKSVGCISIWGFGSDFDVVILRNAYHVENLEWPFKYYNHRCLRTLTRMLDVEVKRNSGTHHNAFSDAVNQGKALIECLKLLNKYKESAQFDEDDSLV